MNRLVIQYESDELVVLDGNNRLADRKISEDDYNQFKEWIDTYNNTLQSSIDQQPALLSLGQKIYTWLNGGQNWLGNYLKNISEILICEFCIPVRSESAQNAFVEVPWELMADETGFLAKDASSKFCPVRRIGQKSEDIIPSSEYKLNTTFMAASPRKVKPELDYEQEECAILNLHGEKAVNMDLFVEESGNLSILTELINEVKPVDVLHISCHGNIAITSDQKTDPFLFLESPTGMPNPVTATQIEQTLAQNKPRLLFLSACKTSGSHENDSEQEEKDFSSLTQNLVNLGFPAVLGWSGSVSDKEATRFAGSLYRYLSQGALLEEAVANARFGLFIPPEKEETGYQSRDWHLARLFIGSKGGGVLSNSIKERFMLDKDAGAKEFLGKKKNQVPVATRKEFVGRRRQLQDILKEIDDKKHAGVLIHGFGNMGKSSLAARVKNRLHNYQTLLVFGEKGNERMYKAPHVLTEFQSISGVETSKWIDVQRPQVNDSDSSLRPVIKELLEKHFSGSDEEHKPVLMVIDDLEKILEPPQSDGAVYRVKSDYQKTLVAIIKAFKEANTKSRLILTSRYDFDLYDEHENNVAQDLLRIPLSSMTETESRKQYAAKYGTKAEEQEEIKLEPTRIVKACKGNPGLQDIVFRLFNEAPQSYQKALQEMENYLESGTLPEEREVQYFLEDLAIEELLALLTNQEKDLLRVATSFEIPVPGQVFDAIANEIGIQEGVDYQKRLLGFGIFEAFEGLVNPQRDSFLLNRLVKARIKRLSVEEEKAFAGIIAENLFEVWVANEQQERPWICDFEIVRFGLMADHVDSVTACAEDCLRGMYKNFLTKDATPMAINSVNLLESTKTDVPIGLYHIASDICHQTGEVEKARDYIEKALLLGKHDENGSLETASSLLRLGRISKQLGDIDSAESTFEKAKSIFNVSKSNREIAIVTGEIARIKLSKGEVEAALQLHEEELKVYEQLGDTRSKAVTLGEIARIKADKGEVEAALELHEERLQVFGQLGDTRSKAVTLGDIARIKLSKGEVEAALQLHEEELKVYEQLGDTRSKAVTLGDIARIKKSKGEVEAALQLHEERLRVYDKLENLDGRANALWSMAQILKEKEEIQKAYEYFAESYEINLKLGRLDGICYVGLDLGVLLCQAQHKDDGIKILERSKAGFKKLGRMEMAQQVEQIIQHFK